MFQFYASYRNRSNPLGQPINMAEADDRIFGVVLMNDCEYTILFQSSIYEGSISLLINLLQNLNLQSLCTISFYLSSNLTTQYLILPQGLHAMYRHGSTCPQGPSLQRTSALLFLLGSCLWMHCSHLDALPVQVCGVIVWCELSFIFYSILFFT